MKHFIFTVVTVLALALVTGCDKAPKPAPTPGPTPGPDPEPKPAAPFFRADLPAECVINLDQGVVAWTVETNITDWTASSSEPWCKVIPKADQLWLEVENYDARDDNGYERFDPPRTCTVTVTAGTVFNKSFKLIQQTHTRVSLPQLDHSGAYDWIRSEPSGAIVLLSADGQSRDLTVSSNAWRWVPETNASWLKAEYLNSTTLRLTSTARPESETAPRSATVKIYDKNNELEFTTFQVQDAPAKVGGPDLDYGDHTDWD